MIKELLAYEFAPCILSLQLLILVMHRGHSPHEFYKITN
jgi:hypothetical protein